MIKPRYNTTFSTDFFCIKKEQVRILRVIIIEHVMKIKNSYINDSTIIFVISINFPDPPFEAQDTLRAWQEKNHPWLELSDVHKETTENIRVTVIPFYMGYRENQNTNVYWVR